MRRLSAAAVTPGKRARRAHPGLPYGTPLGFLSWGWRCEKGKSFITLRRENAKVLAEGARGGRARVNCLTAFLFDRWKESVQFRIVKDLKGS